MKKNFKFNIIDAIVILAVIGVVFFVALKVTDGLVEKPKERYEYEFTFHSYETPNFVKDYLKTGSTVKDYTNNEEFGKVTSVSYGEAEIYNLNAEGQTVKSTKEDHCSVDVVVKGEGEPTECGVKLDKGIYGVGHSITIKLGDAKIFGKISGIKKLDKIEE